MVRVLWWWFVTVSYILRELVILFKSFEADIGQLSHFIWALLTDLVSFLHILNHSDKSLSRSFAHKFLQDRRTTEEAFDYCLRYIYLLILLHLHINTIITATVRAWALRRATFIRLFWFCSCCVGSFRGARSIISLKKVDIVALSAESSINLIRFNWNLLSWHAWCLNYRLVGWTELTYLLISITERWVWSIDLHTTLTAIINLFLLRLLVMLG